VNLVKCNEIAGSANFEKFLDYVLNLILASQECLCSMELVAIKYARYSTLLNQLDITISVFCFTLFLNTTRGERILKYAY
jgi:hypothetical protein